MVLESGDCGLWYGLEWLTAGSMYLHTGGVVGTRKVVGQGLLMHLLCCHNCSVQVTIRPYLIGCCGPDWHTDIHIIYTPAGSASACVFVSRIGPCCAVPCRAVPCRAVPCLLCPAVPCLLCRALPCRAVPRRAASDAVSLLCGPMCHTSGAAILGVCQSDSLSAGDTGCVRVVRVMSPVVTRVSGPPVS